MKLTRIRYFCLILLFQLIHNSSFSQKLISKPFTGHCDQHEINGWCMFKDADTVFLKLTDAGGQTSKAEYFVYSHKACFRKYLPVNYRFNALQEGRSYTIQYSFDGIRFYPLITASTTTDSVKDLSFLAGSCAFIGTGFNGILKPFNDLKIFQYMQRDTADMMLWLGDNLYYVFKYHSYKGELKRNIKTRLNKRLSGFLASKQNYSIWDDHDYGSNNSGASFKEKSSSLNVFQQFWPNPKNDSANYYSFKQQDCGFFMLDDRYNNEKEEVVLGKKQMSWLEQELLHSNSTFKFICIGMQALNPLSTMECFYKTKEEYKELVSFIREHHISGVIFISGDRHHGELMKVQEEGLYPLYDFTTSPLTMYPVHLSSKSSEFVNPYKIRGTYFPNYNYGKISVRGKKEARLCTIELKDKRGRLVWTYSIPASELK